MFFYELTKKPYKDKKVNNKFSLKKKCVTHSGFNIKDLLMDVMKSSTQYLKRRLYVQNKYHFKKILDSVSEIGLIFCSDYSENLQPTPKFEPQSAHFNKRQHSMHCAVAHFNDLDSNDEVGNISAFII